MAPPLPPGTNGLTGVGGGSFPPSKGTKPAPAPGGRTEGGPPGPPGDDGSTVAGGRGATPKGAIPAPDPPVPPPPGSLAGGVGTKPPGPPGKRFGLPPDGGLEGSGMTPGWR